MFSDANNFDHCTLLVRVLWPSVKMSPENNGRYVAEYNGRYVARVQWSIRRQSTMVDTSPEYNGRNITRVETSPEYNGRKLWYSGRNVTRVQGSIRHQSTMVETSPEYNGNITSVRSTQKLSQQNRLIYCVCSWMLTGSRSK